MSTSPQNNVVSYAAATGMVRLHAEALFNSFSPDQETIGIAAGLGRVLAEPVYADRDQPPFNRSTRDGFACRAADLAGGAAVTVAGSLRAGETGTLTEVRAGQAVEIMTGAPVPPGADCVVMVEHVEHHGETLRLSTGRSLRSGENIVPQGAEARAGALILPRGTRVAAAQIGAMAACGLAELLVYRRPRVAIVATGDELVELDRQPLTHQIRNSNSYSLAAQVSAAGAEPVRLPIARDERGPLEKVMRAGLESDLLLLSGGVSMGKYDLVEEVLLSLGAEFYFTGALIQPGKPVVFGSLPSEGKRLYFFGLPGNPVSTMVTFSLFAWPFLSALGGEPFRGPRFGLARLTEEVVARPGLTRFLPARLRVDETDVTVQPVTWQGSGDLAAVSRCDCFVVVPEECSRLAAGETARILLA